jgi:uncharacterized metal-binding protein
MVQDCCACGDNIMILACSGGSNVGQLSNQAAVELTQEGCGKMYCLAGIGGQLKGFVQSARDVPMIAAIDGCSVGCAKAILKNAGVDDYRYFVLTDLGIEKNKNLSLNAEEVRKVKDAVRATCAGQAAPGAAGIPTVKGGCCG